MKKFLSTVLQWKQTTAMFFAGSLFILCIIYLLFGKNFIEVSTVFWIMALSAISTFLQQLFFTHILIKKLRYTTRLTLFIILFATVFVLTAVLLNWFPTGSVLSWLIFIGIFIAIFILITAIYEIYFSIVGKRYDGILGQYKKGLDEKKNKQ